MQKINFQNLPNTTTPVNATNLNTLQTNVENEFNGTNWTALNNYVFYCKRAGIVFVEIMCGDGSFSIQGLTTIGVLPTGFKPSGRVDFDYHKLSGSDTSSYAYINTSGEIKLGNNGNNEIKWFGGSVSFPV